MPNEQHPGKPDPKKDVVTTSFSTVFVHLTWVFVGPILLGGLLIGIVQSAGERSLGLDVGVVIAVGLMLGARWLDQWMGESTTVYGEPSTWADVRRYSMLLPAVAVAGWIAATVAAQYL